MDEDDHRPAVTDMTVVLVVLTMSLTAGAGVAIACGSVPRTWRDNSAWARPARIAQPGMFEQVGRKLRSVVRLPANAEQDRAVGGGAIMAVAIGVVHLGFAVIAALALWGRSMSHRRRKHRQTADRVGAALGDVIDLFAVALLSGNTVGEAVRQVSDWSDDDVAEAFAWCTRQAASGRALGDVLEQLPTRLGPQIRPLVAALVATERYGAPIASNLAQLAIDTRSDRRRRAEAAARRLPVVLLFPLVSCVLPAFLLVTIVPVVIETITNFDIAASP